MKNTNTRNERWIMWLTWHLFGWGSPSLKVLGLRPTLRWVGSGMSEDAAKIHALTPRA